MIVGDSVATTLAPGLARAASSHGLEVWNVAVPGCGLAQDAGELFVDGWEHADPACTPGWRERWPDQIAQFAPDIVVALLGAHDTFDRRVDGHEVAFDSPEGDVASRGDLQDAVGVLSAGGARVVLLTTPYYRMGWPMSLDRDRSLYNPTWIDRWNTSQRAVATRNAGTVTILDLNRLLAPAGEWTNTIDGIRVRDTDNMHLSAAGSDYVAGWLAPQLVRLAQAGLGPLPTVNAGVG